MNKEHFKILLEDLYDKYNHSKKSEVDNLVEKYNGQEFDAIKTFFFKYNFKAHPSYNPKAGSDTYIRTLIDAYSDNKRTIKENDTWLSPEEESISNIKKQAEVVNSSITEASDSKKNELIHLADEKIKLMDEVFLGTQKHIDELIAKMEAQIAEKSKIIEELTANIPVQQQKESDEFIELKINLDYTETDIALPKGVDSMNVGTRFLMIDQNKKMLAFEIKDVFCDYVSMPGKCIKEINIQRV